MPTIEAPRAESGMAAPAEAEAGTNEPWPASEERGASHPLRGFLAGLNKLLELSDFSRGDIFRD
jgi:hypothetical protein